MTDNNVHEERRISHGDAMNYFTRVGLAVLVTYLAVNAIQTLTVAALELWAPDFIALVRDGTYWWFNWLLSVVPLYFVGAPLFILILPRPIMPIEGKRRFGVGKSVCVIFATVAVTYILSMVGFVLLELMSLVSGGLIGGNDTDSLNYLIQSSPVWVIFLVTCIIAPIGEELLFRKLLIDRLKPFGELSACIFSGLMFGLFHGNLRQFLYAFAIGFLFATVYVKTNNIVYTMVLHFGVNLFGSVISPLLLDSDRLEWMMGVMEEAMNAATNGTPLPEEFVPAVLYELLLVAFLLIGMLAIAAGVVLLIVYLVRTKFNGASVVSERNNREFWRNPGAVLAIVLISASIVYALINLPV